MFLVGMIAVSYNGGFALEGYNLFFFDAIFLQGLSYLWAADVYVV